MADTRPYDGDSAAPIISFASSSLLVVALQIGGLMLLADRVEVSLLMVGLFLVSLFVYVVSVYLIYAHGARRGDLAAMGRAGLICGAALIMNFALLAMMYVSGSPKPPLVAGPAPAAVRPEAFSCTTTFRPNESGYDEALMICLPYESPVDGEAEAGS